MQRTHLFPRLFEALRHFFGTVPGSLKNHLNLEELIRIAITALSAGGGTFGLLRAVMLAAGLIFPAPADAALAAALLSALLEVCRRLGHGAVLAPQMAQRPGPR